MKISPSTVGYVSLILIFLIPCAVFPQNKIGTVKVDPLAVYSRMTIESDVVKTLAKGTVVRILLRVAGEDGDWCGVAVQDSSSRIGYVLCSGLDRPKETPPLTAQGGNRLQILIGSAHVTGKASMRQVQGSGETGLIGQTLAQLPGYSWSSSPKTLLIAIRKSCPYCRASLPFYRQLSDLEKNNLLSAHLLVVMPNDESSGSSFLKEGDVDLQAVFGQDLDDLNVPGTPTLLLLNSSGVIEQTWIGQLTPRMEKDVVREAEE